MNKVSKKSIGSGAEGVILIVLLVLFISVVGVAWQYAMKVRQMVAANAAVMNVDPSALVGVEHLRNVAESQIANSRAFFVLGSKSIFDKQKSDKQIFAEALATFEKQYSLPQIHEIAKRIEALEQQEQEFFDQAMGFREKQTESKIVGQFYQSKTAPILTQLNENFDKIVKLHNAELDHSRNRAREAGLEAQAQIPKGMIWFIGAMSALFLGLTLLVLRMLRVRLFHLRERDRLVDEAKKSILGRDEVIAAVSQDLKDSLSAISETAESLKNPSESYQVAERAELMKSTVVEIEGLISDIYDQKKADMGNLTLRLDQLGMADILEDARVMLQPLAKRRDVVLQFDSVNESVLAFVDRERVMRVLSNLIGNAIKFSRKHTKILIKVRSDQQFVTISIADNGPGIPENKLPTLFDHFWQARSTSDQGSGVGLAIVKTIIEAHGGTVSAKSQAGQGTTFTFTLPRRRPVGAQFKKPSSSTVRRLARTPSPQDNPDGPAI